MRRAGIILSVMVCLFGWAGAPGWAHSAGGESVTGPIKEVRTRADGIKGGGEGVLASILVKGIAFHVSTDTVFLFSDARKATLVDLKVGQRVSARASSEYRDSLPPQVDTDVVVIHVSARPEGRGKR
jgi:hypothetical protein